MASPRPGVFRAEYTAAEPPTCRPARPAPACGLASCSGVEVMKGGNRGGAGGPRTFAPSQAGAASLPPPALAVPMLARHCSDTTVLAHRNGVPHICNASSTSPLSPTLAASAAQPRPRPQGRPLAVLVQIPLATLPEGPSTPALAAVAAGRHRSGATASTYRSELLSDSNTSARPAAPPSPFSPTLASATPGRKRAHLPLSGFFPVQILPATPPAEPLPPAPVASTASSGSL